ncbi:MAG TPA: hypothetical protein V6D22_21195 [Candidatus Obscuribacterales bacterium]
MTAAGTSILHGARVIDFTGTVSEFRQMPGCSDEFTDLVRHGEAPKAVVIVDHSLNAKHRGPVLVRDHLNLTGSSPLLGPNHPAGDRFPVVQGIYVDDVLPELPRVVAAGLKPGVRPTADDMELILRYGGEACCYNVVPAMLLAAHAKRRVLAILVPEGTALPDSIARELHAMTGGK